MTQNEQFIKRDRMRYSKDSLSSGLVLMSIVFDVLYFVSIYKSDVGSYYYTWMIGASVIYNLLFLLTAFLASQGVKNRKSGYGLTLLVLVQIFPLNTKLQNVPLIWRSFISGTGTVSGNGWKVSKKAI